MCSVGYVELRYTPCLLRIVDGRLPTSNTNSITTMVEVASDNTMHKMALTSVRNVAYDFSVKLMCNDKLVRQCAAHSGSPPR